MPDAETNALRRAKTLREEINTRTGIADTTVTEGVKRLLRNSGTEVAIRHEAAMHLDIYPDPIIAREEFSRLMDYGEFEVSEVYSEFKQLEYISANGYSFIDTGLLSNDFDEVNIDCELSTVSIGSSFYGGSDDTGSASRNTKTVIFVENNNRFFPNIGFNNQWKENSSFKPQSNVRYNVNSIMKSGLQTLTVNGSEKIRSTYTGTTNSAYHVWFLNLNYRGTSMVGSGTNQQRGFNGKIYSSNWLLNSNLVRNFVPYVNEYRYISDDSLYAEEVGLLDTLNNVFYKSMGPDPFIKGPYIS